MRADLGALLDHHDAEFGIELLEADRGREPGRPGADDHDVELHRLAGGQISVAHGPLEAREQVRAALEVFHDLPCRDNRAGAAALSWSGRCRARTAARR